MPGNTTNYNLAKPYGYENYNIGVQNDNMDIIDGELKTLSDDIADVVLGSIPDNSLTNAKLGTDIKVGSLALLDTTEKSSVVGAINEIAGSSGGGTAADTTYDNTDSGLIATDVQGAIDETVELVSSKLTKFTGITAGTATALTATISNATLADFTNIQIRLHTDIGADATLNLNGLGAKPIYTSGNVAVGAGALTGSMLNLMYNSTLSRWYLLDILSIQTFDTNTYLYNLGDECTALSGGWTTDSTAGSGNTLTKNAEDITLYSPAGGNYIIMKNSSSVDFTNYSLLKISCTITMGGTSGAHIARVGASWASYSVTATAPNQVNSYDYEFSINIESVYALKQVFLLNNAQAGYPATFIVKKIWLEA